MLKGKGEWINTLTHTHPSKRPASSTSTPSFQPTELGASRGESRLKVGGGEWDKILSLSFLIAWAAAIAGSQINDPGTGRTVHDGGGRIG